MNQSLTATILILGAAIGGYFLGRPNSTPTSTRTRVTAEGEQSTGSLTAEHFESAIAGIERRLALIELKQSVTSPSPTGNSKKPDGNLFTSQEPPDPQKQVAASQERYAEHVADFEKRLTSEPRDRSWASASEQSLRQAAQTASTNGMTVKIDSTDCRTNVCRVVVDATLESGEASLQTRIPFLVDGMSSYTMQTVKAADGTDRIQYDFERKTD